MASHLAAHRSALAEIKDQRYNIEHSVESAEKFEGDAETELGLTQVRGGLRFATRVTCCVAFWICSI